MNRLFAAAALTTLIAAPASAHFQLVYTPDPNIERPGDVPLKLIFWHPMENGHAMDMGAPEDIFAMFKGEKIDLTGSLTAMTFKGADNEAAAYEATLPVKRNGDYIVALTPAPYYEGSEDIYIQQITKTFFNKGGIPTGWDEPLGLPTEFVPLNKPNNVIAGSTFSAQLLSEGAPVAGAEIEIEYIAAEPDMETNAAGEATVGAMPGGALVAITDENGVFTFGVPRAGHWGFAALGSGPDTEHEGKELSQDAVIWIKAYDLE
ncbi:cobalt/nickel transport protein [Rhodovulum bhavnagarense]|uniref:Cobalt/nickel transport protein n=1 Tax=Rhodovulum bhavnagarense TaxID=992286 RepID=A0A4R2R898_9RHOB|nr:DUF4198 domain-containing protein [Rhodovulum bhavnagarense]TCP58414.1 cobalt/nickel transport protein [Rhodovulum bhavnagarense]